MNRMREADFLIACLLAFFLRLAEFFDVSGTHSAIASTNLNLIRTLNPLDQDLRVSGERKGRGGREAGRLGGVEEEVRREGKAEEEAEEGEDVIKNIKYNSLNVFVFSCFLLRV